MTLNSDEQNAAGEAGAEAASFLEKIGKTDLAHLSKDEWDKFCIIFATAYTKHLIDDIPF